jgi:hypothetical protein
MLQVEVTVGRPNRYRVVKFKKLRVGRDDDSDSDNDDRPTNNNTDRDDDTDREDDTDDDK